MEQRFSELRAVLTEMRQLLLKHDAGQEKFVRAVLKAIDRGDGEAAAKLLYTAEFWGGAGSIDDVVLFEIPWTPEFRVDESDNARLRTLVHELRWAMLALNMKAPPPRPDERDSRGVDGRRS